MDDHREALAARGLIKLEGWLPKHDVALACDLIGEIGVRHGLYSDAGWQRASDRFALPKPFRQSIKALACSDRFPDLVSDGLIELAAELVGEPLVPLSPGQVILFTLPGSAPWSVPGDAWHVDFPRLGSLGAPGLQMFACLDDVAPEGGGTLVVTGSHRLLNAAGVLRSRQLKSRLSEDPFFRNLFDTKLDRQGELGERRGRVDGVELDVVELTGQAGDIYLMDLRLLHTPAPNASETARLMATCRLPRAAIARKLETPEAYAQGV